MLVGRPDSFWQRHAWVDEEKHFKHWPKELPHTTDDLVPCDAAKSTGSPQ